MTSGERPEYGVAAAPPTTLEGFVNRGDILFVTQQSGNALARLIVVTAVNAAT